MKIGIRVIVLLMLFIQAATPLPSFSACQSGTSSVPLTVDINGAVRTGTDSVALSDDSGGSKIPHAYPGGITIAPLDPNKGHARVIAANDCNFDKISLENAKITVTSGATVPISNYPIAFSGIFTTPPDSTTQAVWYQLWGYGDIMNTATNQPGLNDEVKATAWLLNPIQTGSDQPSDGSFNLYKKITCLSPIATCKIFFNPNKISWGWPDSTLTGDRRLKVQLLLKKITRSTDVVSIYGGDPNVDNGVFLKSSDTPGRDCKKVGGNKKLQQCKE